MMMTKVVIVQPPGAGGSGPGSGSGRQPRRIPAPAAETAGTPKA